MWRLCLSWEISWVFCWCAWLYHVQQSCLPSSSSTVKEEKGNRDNLSGNRAEAESQSLTGGMNTESLGRVTAGPELQSHRPAWEGWQPKEEGIRVCWYLCLWSLNCVVELMDTTSLSALRLRLRKISVVTAVVGDCVMVKPWSRLWRNPVIVKSLP